MRRSIPTVEEVHRLVLRRGIPFRSYIEFHAMGALPAAMLLKDVSFFDTSPCRIYRAKVSDLFDQMSRDVSPDRRNPWMPRIIETWLCPRKRFDRVLLFARMKALQH